MCNRYVQRDREVVPGKRCIVKMRGPQGEYELEFDEAVFSGCAKSESRNYWIKREGAEDVLVPDISRFGEKHQETGVQSWEPVPIGTAMEGLLLPQPPGKEYRLLKIVTKPATAEETERWGNDRAPVLQIPANAAPPTTAHYVETLPPKLKVTRPPKTPPPDGDSEPTLL